MLVSLLAILTVNGVVLAQGEVEQGDDAKINHSISEVSINVNQVDLEGFVELAFSERITVAQTQSFYEQLTNEQKEKVSDLVAIKAGIPVEKWDQDRKLHQREIDSLSHLNARASLGKSLATSGELWRQPIENTWTSGLPPGSAFATRYFTDQYCDGADADDDYVFYFSMTYSMNPDGLRWTSNSAQVYLAFMTAYGGNLNGFAYTWNEARLCLGTGGVSAAGGPNNVKNNVFLHPNN